MARTRPLPRKLSAPRFGRGKTIHPCSFPRCSLTLCLTVEFIISRLYIYMYTNVTNRSNEFLTNTNIQRKYSVIFQRKFYRGWKFAWPSLLLIDRDEFSMLFYLWTGTENDPFWFAQIIAPGNCKTRFYHRVTIGEELPLRDGSWKTNDAVSMV